MPRRANGEGTIYRRSDGRYAAAATLTTPTGARRRVHVYGNTRDEAHKKLVAKLTRESTGIPTPDKSWTIGEYIDYWLKEIVPVRVRRSTLEHYAFISEHHIRPRLGNKRLSELSVIDVQTAVNQMVAAGISASAIHKTRRVLSGILANAMREELVSRNVARLVTLPSYRPKEIKPWTADEAIRFLETAHGHQWEAGFICLLMYGMRRGEVLGLRWSDIDFENRTFTVQQQVQRISGELLTGPVKTKAGKRTLPLTETLLHVIEQTMPDSFGPEDLILTSTTGRPVEPKNFVRAFRLIASRAGLREITVHTTRHTAATMLKRLGVPARDAQAILGHAHVSTTEQIYQHSDPDIQRAALNAIDGTLGRLSSVRAATEATSTPLLSPLLSKSDRDTFRIDVNPTKKADPTGVNRPLSMAGAAGLEPAATGFGDQFRTLSRMLPTPVIHELRTRSQQLLVGCVAVSVAVKTSNSKQRIAARAGLAQAASELTRQRTADRMHELSFPLNLLPSSPTLATKEARL